MGRSPSRTKRGARCAVVAQLNRTTAAAAAPGRYEGEFKRNCREGNGICEYVWGDKYHGMPRSHRASEKDLRVDLIASLWRRRRVEGRCERRQGRNAVLERLCVLRAVGG